MNYCPYCQIGIDYSQMKKKHCNNCGHDWEIYHVTPRNDVREHIDHYSCLCNPEVTNEGLNMIVIHNSFDGREGVEWTKEILK